MENILFQNEVMAVVERQGYVFSRHLFCDSTAVSILPYRQTEQGREYLAQVEICPAHGPNFQRGSIRAGVPRSETPRQCARRELLALGGYSVDENQFQYLGKVRPCKSSDLITHLFAIDVTGLTPQDAADDPLETSMIWLDFRHGVQVSDPIFITAITRLEWSA